jgi:hypothetical protein
MAPNTLGFGPDVRVGGRWRNSWGVITSSDWDVAKDLGRSKLKTEIDTDVLVWAVDVADIWSFYPSLLLYYSRPRDE